MPELLVNVYSYRLMVKSVSYCCVCAVADPEGGTRGAPSPPIS